MWAKPSKAAEHFGVSRRTIYAWMELGLPCAKINGTTLVDLPEGDQWLRQNFAREQKSDQKGKVVDELLRGLV